MTIKGLLRTSGLAALATAMAVTALPATANAREGSWGDKRSNGASSDSGSRPSWGSTKSSSSGSSDSRKSTSSSNSGGSWGGGNKASSDSNRGGSWGGDRSSSGPNSGGNWDRDRKSSADKGSSRESGGSRNGGQSGSDSKATRNWSDTGGTKSGNWSDGRRDSNSSGNWSGGNKQSDKWSGGKKGDDRKGTASPNYPSGYAAKRGGDPNWRDYDKGRDGHHDRDDRHDRDGNWGHNDGNWGGGYHDRDDHKRWDHKWRDNNRYNWYSYRNSHRNVFNIGVYYAPYRNYSYRRLSTGFFLDSLFFSDRYWIADPWQYRLPEAYGPYRWVRYYDDALLVDIYSGEVVDVIYDFFW